MEEKIIVKESAPGQWQIIRVSDVSAIGGLSIYSDSASAVAAVRVRNPDIEIEIVDSSVP